jgi:ubiquinone/menaquinone biosynthesis C-methylase UbiE
MEPRGSEAFFLDVERKRYEAEPFIHDFASFSSWKGAEVLEIGIGIGSDFMNFVRSGAAMVGIDVTTAAVSLVRKRLELERSAATTLVADAESLPFGDNSFDLVYSWGVLHHTLDTRRAIREVFRVLRPRGEARIMLYSRYSWVSAGLWLRHLFRERRPAGSLVEVISADLESPGTKAFTGREVRELFEQFVTIRMHTYVTPYDRRVGGPLTRLVPAGFFRGIVAVKS